MSNLIGSYRSLRRDQRGVTGLETAIVLIAFVVVASVFAFAILSTGVLASEKTKTSIAGGLAEAGVALAVKGSVIAHASSTGSAGVVSRLQIPILAGTDQAVDLGSSSLIVTYIDSANAMDLTRNANADQLGNSNGGWLEVFSQGTGPVLDSGDRADLWVNVQQLAGGTLNTSEQFTIQIKSEVGAVLEITRTTPGEITTIINLN